MLEKQEIINVYGAASPRRKQGADSHGVSDVGLKIKEEASMTRPGHSFLVADSPELVLIANQLKNLGTEN
jgi:hypothetical protein